MSPSGYQADNPIPERVARLYDDSVPDWPGELDFYRRLVGEIESKQGAVLEIGCGTGRITNRITELGLRVVGIDISQPMLDVAARKSSALPNVRYVCADMRDFDLDETFRLVISPGHSFQNLLTTADQFRCVESVRRHLKPGGRLVLHLDHQDVDWLGRISTVDRDRPEAQSSVTDPESGNVVERAVAWSYERPTQLAYFTSTWRELNRSGAVVNEWSRGPVPVRCIFPGEMEHLFERVELEAEAVYGDFNGNSLTETSEEMIWVARLS